MYPKPLSRPFVLLVFLLGLLPVSQTLAASCKGLSRAQCEGKASCTWVKAYTTKKGNRVSAYCRAKPSKKKASVAAGSKTKTATTGGFEKSTGGKGRMKASEKAKAKTKAKAKKAKVKTKTKTKAKTKVKTKAKVKAKAKEAKKEKKKNAG